MKKEKEKRKKQGAKERILLLPPIRTPSSPASPFSHNFVWSGKIPGERTVAFRVILPCLSNGESQAFFETLRDAVLLFWKKESEKPGEEVWFGGLELLWKEDHLALFFCYSPFSQREYRLCAQIALTEAGAIRGVFPQKKIRKRERPKWRSQRNR